MTDQKDLTPAQPTRPEARDEPASTLERAPAISVIVVNYNGGDYLRGCMESLARQTFTDFETIVIDNASADDSLDRIGERPPELLIYRETENHGFARGNNLGAARARGRWLALLNPDAEADPDWLQKMMEAVERRPTHRVVASLQVSLHDPRVLDGAGDCYLAWGYAWRGGFGAPVDRAPGQPGECFAPCAAAALYPRDLFLSSGGFDERYFCYHEDVDLGFRLRLLGERCQYDPACRVRHAGSALSGRNSAFSVFHGMRNGVWTYVKNIPGPLLLVTIPVWVAGLGALLVRGALKGQFRSTLRGFAAAFSNLGPALAQRKRLQALRRVSLIDLAGAMTWNPFSYLRRRIDVRPFKNLPGAALTPASPHDRNSQSNGTKEQQK